MSGRIQTPSGTNLKIGNSVIGSGSNNNIGIGDQPLRSLSVDLGNLSLYSAYIQPCTSMMQAITTGSYNVLLGSYQGFDTDLDIRTSSNFVVLSDGQYSTDYQCKW